MTIQESINCIGKKVCYNENGQIKKFIPTGIFYDTGIGTIMNFRRTYFSALNWRHEEIYALKCFATKEELKEHILNSLENKN